MNLNLIRNYVLRNNYYSINYNEYFIPRYIKTSGKITLNMEKIINNFLSRKESSYSRKFREDIKIFGKTYKNYSNYIREFPIIIENRNLWNNILNFLCIKDKNLERTNYFLLDFFFPYLGVIVEIDSEYHDVKQRYDIARDMYIKRIYGLDTLRFYKYGENDLERVAFLDKFKKNLNYLIEYYRSNNFRECIYPLDFSQTMINNFIEDNKLPLKFIDELINYIGEYKFMYLDNFNLSLEEIKKIDSSLFPDKKNKYERGSIEQMLLDNVIIILKQIYGKSLVVT